MNSKPDLPDIEYTPTPIDKSAVDKRVAELEREGWSVSGADPKRLDQVGRNPIQIVGGVFNG